MTKEEFIQKWDKHILRKSIKKAMLSDLDQLIQDEIERRMPSEDLVISNAINYRRSTVNKMVIERNAFIAGVDWVKSKLLKP